MIDQEILLILLGAGLSLVGAVVGSITQHFLSLRADRVRRERDKEERERQLVRETLLKDATSINPDDLAKLRLVLRQLSSLQAGAATDEEKPKGD
jgi:flagellar motor component MotA